MPRTLAPEWLTPLVLACLVIGVPVALARALAPSRIGPQRLIEAFALAAVLAAVAHGLVGEAAARGVSLAVITFSALRINRNRWHTDPSESDRGARAPGDPLFTVAALGVYALVQPIGPTAALHGWGMLIMSLFIYGSSNTRLAAGGFSLLVLWRTATVLFT